MRRPRLTYEGAFHHVMNRGLEGKIIFPNIELKDFFQALLKTQSSKTKIRLLAYCIMGNHYHLILQNSSGKMSQFMRNLNGRYGTHYRKKEGGKGYVFQDRYKSTLIEKDPYLPLVIVYTLLNPLRAGLVEDPYEYEYSSISEYFGKEDDPITDNEYVEEIFQTQAAFLDLLEDWSGRKLPITETDSGKIVGREGFHDMKEEDSDGSGLEYSFSSPHEVIGEFEESNGVKVENIDTAKSRGKKLRLELLYRLKEEAGLTYGEINNYPLFDSLSYSSLGKLFQRAKGRLDERGKF